MKAFAATLLCGALLCLWLVQVRSLVVTSLGSVLHLATIPLASKLQRFIEHEEKRLNIIKNVSKYEDEEPLVIQRIKEFKILHKDLVRNETANGKLVKSVQEGHPTSVFAVIRNFMANWNHMLTNETLYGKRLVEFLKKDNKMEFPNIEDLKIAGTALTVIMTTYNISLSDVIKGNILGHQGEPLNAADCYDIGKACIGAQLVDAANEWLEAAFKDIDLNKLKKDGNIFNITDALVIFSKIVFQNDESARAIDLLEKAAELEPEDQILHQLYLQYRFGRDVKPIPSFDSKKMEKWRAKFFGLCREAALSPLETNTTLSLERRRCRYRYSTTVPYRRYQEEILSYAPFISVIHNFVSDREITLIKNDTKGKFYETVLPGNDKATLWQYKALLMGDRNIFIRNISSRIGDVTGLNVSQVAEYYLGEPFHAMDFGIAGTCLPHGDYLKTYRQAYMRIHPGNRLATVQVFIGDTKYGGSIVFMDPEVSIKPRKGMALLYYNYRPDGRAEERAYMGTCPLGVGENIVLEKGIWTTGLDNNVLCGKSSRSTFIGVEKFRMHRRTKRTAPGADKEKSEPEAVKDNKSKSSQDV